VPPAARPRLLQPSQTNCDTDIVIDESQVKRIESPFAVSARSVAIVESNLGAVNTGDTATTSCQLLQPVSGHNLVHFQGDNQFFLLFWVPGNLSAHVTAPVTPPAARSGPLQPSQTIWDMDIVIDESEVDHLVKTSLLPRTETPSAVSSQCVDIFESNLGGERAINTVETATTCYASYQCLQPDLSVKIWDIGKRVILKVLRF
jgi:hypothetical protein